MESQIRKHQISNPLDKLKQIHLIKQESDTKDQNFKRSNEEA